MSELASLAASARLAGRQGRTQDNVRRHQQPLFMKTINSHARNDRFSLLLHREAAEAIAHDEALLGRAEAILWRWKRSNGINACRDWDEWLSLIARGRSVVVQTMLSEDEHAARLRQSSPFSVLVPPRKRWALLKEARRE